MTQLDLFGAVVALTRAHAADTRRPAGHVLPDLIAQPPANGTDTSIAAADRIQTMSRTKTDEARLVAWLRTCGGHTDQEIQARFSWSGDYSRPRRWSLVRAGLVEDSGFRRQLPNGNLAKVWKAVAL